MVINRAIDNHYPWDLWATLPHIPMGIDVALFLSKIWHIAKIPYLVYTEIITHELTLLYGYEKISLFC